MYICNLFLLFYFFLIKVFLSLTSWISFWIKKETKQELSAASFSAFLIIPTFYASERRSYYCPPYFSWVLVYFGPLPSRHSFDKYLPVSCVFCLGHVVSFLFFLSAFRTHSFKVWVLYSDFFTVHIGLNRDLFLFFFFSHHYFIYYESLSFRALVSTFIKLESSYDSIYNLKLFS